MRFSRPLSLITLAVVALPLAAGCGTKVDDCNKVIGVHNAHVEGVKELDVDKPEGIAKLAGTLDKTSTEIAALDVKDEGVKTRAKALAEHEKAAATALREMGVVMKTMTDDMEKVKAVPSDSPDALEKLKKMSDDIDKQGKDMTAKSEVVTKTTEAKDKAWAEFQTYCEVGAK